jgi:TetR/AcrR family transcriptional regulator, cholesterol catabolism regulator
MAVERRATKKIREDLATLKRERIVDAATELFYTRGFHNTTLDDVAERLGMTKPFIYNSFGSKTALLAEICGRGVQSALDEIDRALRLGTGPGETFAVFVPRYVAAILRAQKNIAINIREEKNLDPADAERLSALRQTFIARVEQLMRAGRDQGEILVEDPRIAAFVVVGAVSWSTFWYNPGGALPAEVITARMSTVIANLAKTHGFASASTDA